jgi:O-antigen/teichoic acid export membrane protein
MIQTRDLSRRFAANVMYGIGQRFVQLIVGGFVLGYAVRKLGTEEWGLVVLTTSIVTIISFVQLSASAGLGKRLNEFRTCGDVVQFRAYFSVSIILSLFLSTAVCLLIVAAITVFWPLFAVPDHYTTEGRIVLSAIGGSIIFNILALPSIACLQAAHRIDIHARSQSLSLLLRSAAVVILFEYTTPSASTYAYAVLFTSLFAFLQLWIWVRQNMPEARAEFHGVTRARVKELVGFNLLNALGTVNYILFMQAPVFVMRHDLHLVGLYGIALQINNMVRGVFFSGHSALLPLMVTLNSKEDSKRLMDLFVVSTKFFVASSVIAWAWLSIVGPDVLALWLGSRQDLSDLIYALPLLVLVTSMAIGAMPAAALVVTMEKLNVTTAVGGILVVAMVTSLFVVVEPSVLCKIAALQALCFGLYCLSQTLVAVRCLRIGYLIAARDFVFRPIIPGLLAGSVLLFGRGVVSLLPKTELALLTILAMFVFAVSFWFQTIGSHERMLILSGMGFPGPINKDSWGGS